jgi:hypothetical protein
MNRSNAGPDEWCSIIPTEAQIERAKDEIRVVMNWGCHLDATFDDVSAVFDLIFHGDGFKNYPDDLYWQMEAIAHDEGENKIWLVERKPPVIELIDRYCEDYVAARSYEIAKQDAENPDYL